jgi:hypothetical protein
VAAAATLARKLGGQCSIHVIESAEAATAGLAEATHPTVLDLLRQIGVDQNDFVDKTQSTYSLGTRLVDWATPGQSSWHPFGAFGALIERRPFYHYWHKARVLGLKPRLDCSASKPRWRSPIASSSRPTRSAWRNTCVMRCTWTAPWPRVTCAASRNAPA